MHIALSLLCLAPGGETLTLGEWILRVQVQPSPVDAPVPDEVGELAPAGELRVSGVVEPEASAELVEVAAPQGVPALVVAAPEASAEVATPRPRKPTHHRGNRAR